MLLPEDKSGRNPLSPLSVPLAASSASLPNVWPAKPFGGRRPFVDPSGVPCLAGDDKPQGDPVGPCSDSLAICSICSRRSGPTICLCVRFAGKTFRHAMYGEYKVQRAEMPDTLCRRFRDSAVIAALGIPALDCESFEADDVLLPCALSEERGDSASLSATIRLPTIDHRSRKGLQHPQERGVRRRGRRTRVGIIPAQVVDYQALVGDSVDNVPGCR